MDDRAEIEALIYKYTYHLDLGQYREFADMFAKGSWSIAAGLESEQGLEITDADELVTWAEANMHTYENGILRTKHVTTNVTIDVADGAESATASMYLTVFQGVPPEFPLQVIFCGRYEDEFVKDEGAWRFDKRLIHTDVTGDLSRHVKFLDG